MGKGKVKEPFRVQAQRKEGLKDGMYAEERRNVDDSLE